MKTRATLVRMKKRERINTAHSRYWSQEVDRLNTYQVYDTR